MKPVFVRMEHVEMFQKFQTGSFNTQSNSMSKSNDELTAKMLENVTQLHKIEIIQLKVHAFHRNCLDWVSNRYITFITSLTGQGRSPNATLVSLKHLTSLIYDRTVRAAHFELHHLNLKTEVNDLEFFIFKARG